MWEEYRKSLEKESINDLISMASIIKEELHRRGASLAWEAVGRA